MIQRAAASIKKGSNGKDAVGIVSGSVIKEVIESAVGKTKSIASSIDLLKLNIDHLFNFNVYNHEFNKNNRIQIDKNDLSSDLAVKGVYKNDLIYYKPDSNGLFTCLTNANVSLIRVENVLKVNFI